MTRRFVNGLNYRAQKFVTVAEPRNLNEAYWMAGKYYLVHQKEREAQKRDRKNAEVEQQQKKARTDRPEQRQDNQCGRTFQGQDNQVNGYNCNPMGHRAYECRKPRSQGQTRGTTKPGWE
ncbi:unnamed protein product [Cuscuta europaea]|uniref:CCHC-type domain-containing protein n=1 Tax=Cuscuta europaea TaxID=41803 RepID=A0A9P0ZW83_CUSEU|nr:unnamed protein product [Cuscuta europaea]